VYWEQGPGWSSREKKKLPFGRSGWVEAGAAGTREKHGLLTRFSQPKAERLVDRFTLDHK